MHATAETLDDQKVRLSIEVDPPEFEKAIEETCRRLAREIRVPGFRKGKVPRQIVVQRLGREYIESEALRDSLPDFYVQAVTDTDIDPVAMPSFGDVEGGHGEAVKFTATVIVRPTPEAPDYNDLRVTVPRVEVTEEDIEGQLDAFRHRWAELEPVSRPVANADYVLLDVGAEMDGEAVSGLTLADLLYEVGSGEQVPGLDAAIEGLEPGASTEFDAPLPPSVGERAGEEAHWRVTVKDVKQKVLPDLDDDFVDYNSEFETVAELRADLAERLRVARLQSAGQSLRNGLLDQLVGALDVELPAEMLAAEVERRLRRFVHDLDRARIDFGRYLAITGLTPSGLEENIRTEAEVGLKVDLLLRGVARREGLEVPDKEIETALLTELAGDADKAAEVYARLRAQDSLDAVRVDILKAKALRLLLDRAVPVDEDGNVVELPLGEAAAPDLSAAVEQPAVDHPNEETDET